MTEEEKNNSPAIHRSPSGSDFHHLTAYSNIPHSSASTSARGSNSNIPQNPAPPSDTDTEGPSSRKATSVVHYVEDIRKTKIGNFRPALYRVGARTDAEPKEVAVDIIFVPEANQNPYTAWQDSKKDKFWPEFVGNQLHNCRVWSYGYHGDYSDEGPISTAATILINSYAAQRRIDTAAGVKGLSSTHPRVIFIAVGFGGVLVKKVLLDCLNSRRPETCSFWSCCTGIVFIETPHLAHQKMLRRFARGTRFYPKCVRKRLQFNPQALLEDTESINEKFLRKLPLMPATLCITNQIRVSILRLDKANGTLLSRREPGDNHPVHERSRMWHKCISDRDGVFTQIKDKLEAWKEAEPRTKPSHPSLDNTKDAVRLLSLDGGGVRGLCSLLILERIMREIERIEIEQDPGSRHRVRIPADYFDLAGGTSTGGLICIMLFRLRMDIQSAIVEYKRLSPEIFRQSRARFIGGNIAKAAVGKPWFKGRRLKRGVRRIVNERLPYDEKDRLGDNVSEATLKSELPEIQEGTCKTFVVALKREDRSAVLLRSYTAPSENDAEFNDCKIWQAARATSAAPFYFPTAKIGETRFWDGGLAHNNPIQRVWDEGGRLFPDNQTACIVSLGTGCQTRRPKKTFLPIIGKGKSIMKNLTEVERVNDEFEEGMITKNKPFYRFNPSTGEDEIGLAEYKRLGDLETYTKTYLEDPDEKQKIHECARRLVRIQPQVPADEEVASKAEAVTSENETTPGNLGSTKILGFRRKMRNRIGNYFRNSDVA